MRTFFKSKLFTLILLLVVILVFFGVMSHGRLLNPINLRSILGKIVISSLLTIGAGCLMISGQIDLSTGAVGTMCGMLMAVLLKGGVPWPLAALAALALGGVVGIVNAALIQELNFQGFIATMAMASIAQGLTYAISNAQAIAIENKIITTIGNGRFLKNTVPYAMLGVFVIFLIYGIMLARSKFGRQIYLVGGNPKAAYLSGINPKRMSYLLFMNSGLLGGLAGALLAAQLKSGTVAGIVTSQFAGMTAAMLGGISFGGGSGGMAGAFVGLLILNTFNNGMTILEMNPYWMTFASGALLIIALALDVFSSRRRSA
jgi:ribose/xylose/arabinose/galactoside ABC-type transport system permease subunit